MDETTSQSELDQALKELQELKAHAKSLSERNSQLREANTLAPRRITLLEEKLKETKSLLSKAASENQNLVSLLQETRSQIAKLKTEVEKLSQPPSGYGVFLSQNPDGTVDIQSAGRKLRVEIHPDLTEIQLRKGQEVVLNESLNVVSVREGEKTGEIVSLKEILSDGKRALVKGRTDQERVVDLCDDLQGVAIEQGTLLLCANNADLLIEVIPKPELEDHVLV